MPDLKLVASGGVCAPIAARYALANREHRRTDPAPPRWWQRRFWTGSVGAALDDAFGAERGRDLWNYDLFPRVAELLPTLSAPRGAIQFHRPPDLKETTDA